MLCFASNVLVGYWFQSATVSVMHVYCGEARAQTSDCMTLSTTGECSLAKVLGYTWGGPSALVRNPFSVFAAPSVPGTGAVNSSDERSTTDSPLSITIDCVRWHHAKCVGAAGSLTRNWKPAVELPRHTIECTWEQLEYYSTWCYY